MSRLKAKKQLSMSDEWEECYDDVIRIKIASPQVCAWVANRPPEVYFTNVLQAAFIQKIPKAQKDTTDDLTVFLRFWDLRL